VTSTASELNFVDGSVAGTIVNSKAVIYGAAGEVNATTLALAGTTLTPTAAEINYVSGVTSAIQTQIDTKAPSASPTLSGTITVTGGTQSWTAVASGTTLTFAYNGVNKMKLDSDGNITVIGNVTAYGTV
jgi:cytoskeletal protein CcmA (bactofilin family)